jgi:hypothetical protein
VSIRRIGACGLRTGGQGQAAADNSWKLAEWARIVRDAPDGARVLLVDSDTAVTGSLDELWAHPFDVAITTRPKGSRFPLNAGVVAVRVSPATRAFMDEWLREDREMLAHPARLRPWRQRYGGQNQASLGAVLERGGHGLDVARIPCEVWNAEDDSWHTFGPDTRILHVKGALRLAVFSMDPERATFRAAAAAWRAAEREIPAVDEVTDSEYTKSSGIQRIQRRSAARQG